VALAQKSCKLCSIKPAIAPTLCKLPKLLFDKAVSASPS